jgi:hypothetical protein
MATPAWVNPTGPSDADVLRVIRDSGMSPYSPAPFRGGGGEEGGPSGRTRRPPERTREKWVGHFYIKLEGRRDNCTVRLYLYNFKRGALTLKGMWSGYDKATCDHQFEKTIIAAQQYDVRRSWPPR